MAQGYKDFTAGAVLTAADLEDYCENQSIMRFASAAARDTALATVKTEGMMAYLIDVNTVTVYTGAAWSTIGPILGAPTAWTPTCTQSATPTFTITEATYQRIGRRITGTAVLTFTATPGTANNIIVLGLPVAAAGTNISPGQAWWFDSSTGFYNIGVLQLATSTTVQVLSQVASAGSTTPYFGQTGSVNGSAVASGDVISYGFSYTASADA